MEPPFSIEVNQWRPADWTSQLHPRGSFIPEAALWSCNCHTWTFRRRPYWCHCHVSKPVWREQRNLWSPWVLVPSRGEKTRGLGQDQHPCRHFPAGPRDLGLILFLESSYLPDCEKTQATKSFQMIIQHLIMSFLTLENTKAKTCSY